jgi:exodeoxyribonuclease V alpha subunit
MRISTSKKRELALAAALVSRLGSEGHTCLDLNSPLGSVSVEDVSGPDMDLPDPVAWIAALRAEPVVGTPGEFRPLILDAAGRLYFHRAFMEERMLAEKLLNMNAQKREFDENRLRESMKGFFGKPSRPRRSPLSWPQPGPCALSRADREQARPRWFAGYWPCSSIWSRT